MFRRAVTASFITLFLTTLSFAQEKPNLSGTWKLNTAKSDFGVLPGPESQTIVVDHSDPALKLTVNSVTAQSGKQDYTANFTTDGKECVNQIATRDVKSTLNWEGSNLVVNSKFNLQDQDVTVHTVWTLAPDGKTLTQNVHLASAMGETDQKLVYEKQDAGAPAVATTAPPASSSAPAGPRPNFSGTWKLNTAKSDFGPIPGPDSQTNVIEHNDPAMKIKVSSKGGPGDQDFVLNFTTDGKPAVNQMGPAEVKSTAAWSGSLLVVSGTFKYQDTDVTLKDSLTLSPDGKIMTEHVNYSSAMGEAEQNLVYDRQDAGAAAPTPSAAPQQNASVMPSGSRPNFSGVWKLNTAKSDFGVMPGPDIRTDVIEHNDPNFKVSRKENGPDGAREYVLVMTTDGKETINKLAGTDAALTATWEGAALVVNFKMKLQDQDIAVHQIATLSPDGKTLTNKSHVVMSLGEMDQTEVYDKQ